jgi:hypothetical protein
LRHDALHAQAGDEKLLRGQSALRPRPFVLTRREATGTTNTVGEGRRLEQHDDALAHGHARTLLTG